MSAADVRVLRAGRWTLAADRSSAAFAVRNLGFKTVHGSVPMHDAVIDVDADGRVGGVRATLDLAAIDSGNARRDHDLRKPKLLDTVRNPTMTFDSESVEPDGDNWRVDGRLYACGHAVRVTLAASIDAAADAAAGSDPAVVHATTTFDRRSLGIRAPRFMIGTVITVTIEATFEPSST